MSTINKELQAHIDKYCKLEKVPEHLQYVEKLIKENDIKRLDRLLGKRLAFGTAGIRGQMGPGFSQINDLVIIQTSQGICSYLLEVLPEDSKKKGVIIGNDARHNSDRFARLAALAFMQKGIPVHFCDNIIATPLIAFGVRHFGCCAGIVITASHNPKRDNGYKVYGPNGAQILSPHDKNIQAHIMKEENQVPWPKAWHHDLLQRSESLSTPGLPEDWTDLLRHVHGDLCKAYFSYIETLVDDRRDRNKSSDICITYTAMHGVGHVFLSRALELAGFDDSFPVESQKKPDPEFSTVKFPNPEEAGALDMAFETARHANSNLILANDPDADRCGAALYNPRTGYRRILNGNEIGSLLGWWIWHCFNNDSTETTVDTLTYVDSQGSHTTPMGTATSATSPSANTALTGGGSSVISKAEPKDCYMLSTAVSSKFLESMAKVEGFNFVETLTGFKYMGNAACDLQERGKTVLFAYEEAIGFMVDTTILDKDGITAAIQLAQCAAHVSIAQGRNLEQHLDWLYATYGYHYNVNSYYLCTDQKVIKQIFTTLQSNYPSNFGKDFPIKRVRDLNNGYDSGEPDKRAKLPCSTSSYMVTFFVGSDITLTIRTSGTEPKIKYYSEIVAKLPKKAAGAATKGATNPATAHEVGAQLKAKEAAQSRLHKLVDAAIDSCLQPKQYNLQPADE